MNILTFYVNHLEKADLKILRKNYLNPKLNLMEIILNLKKMIQIIKAKQKMK